MVQAAGLHSLEYFFRKPFPPLEKQLEKGIMLASVRFSGERMSKFLVQLATATLITALCWGTSARATVIAVLPHKDNTIYSGGDFSNAKGDLFAGVTPNSDVRRALMQFDISGIVPVGATINSVSLAMVQTKIGPAGGASFELHKLTNDWGEGTSIGSGGGALATTGDATWNYSFYNTTSWTATGGDFNPTPSAALFLSRNGSYTFSSTAALVSDVQTWLNSPATNFGWILLDPVQGPTSARQFGSRESATNTPVLTIDYTAVPEPTSALTLCIASMFAAMRCRRAR